MQISAASKSARYPVANGNARTYCQQFETWWAAWIANPENKQRMFNVWLASIPHEKFIDDERTSLGRELSKDGREGFLTGTGVS